MNNKQIKEKADGISRAWEDQAGSDVFNGVDLAGFQAKVQEAGTVRQKLHLLRSQEAAVLQERDLVDAQLNDLNKGVAHGVRGHASHGPNSPLYRAMGFVPESERGSGLTTKSAEHEAAPARNGAALVTAE